MEAIREKIKDYNSSDVSHAGLLMQRYLSEQKNSGEGDPEKWDDFFDRIIKASFRDMDTYRRAYSRWCEGWYKNEAPFCLREFNVKGRMVCGLGVASATETGLSLHHTYGVPVIPGSSIKGVAANYCDMVWGKEKPAFKEGGEAFSVIFGTVEEQGHIVFYDALAIPGKINLHRDIMTPHHQSYYTKKGLEAPSDFDSPVPVSFISVSGSFLVALECDDPSEEGRSWLDLALNLVTEALEKWGVGGKTSSGYGRLAIGEEVIPSEPPKKDIFSVGNVISVIRVKPSNKKKKDRPEFRTRGEERYLCSLPKSLSYSIVDSISIGDIVDMEIVNNDLDAKPVGKLYVKPLDLPSGG